MDSIDNLIESMLLSERSIVEAVDEYTLYCFYLGFEPELRKSYNCPFRDDDKPSWSLFETKFTDSTCEYRWKDSGAGLSGDVFTLVQHLYGLSSRTAAVGRIREQISTGFSEEQREEQGKITINKRPQDHGSTSINIRARCFSESGLGFWARYGISATTLTNYQVQEVELISLRNDDMAQPIIVYPKGLCFAYRVIDKYKIYQPYSADYKFRNNYTEKMIEGFFQLEYKQDTLIITKSLKDVMVLNTLGYEAVSARSESTRVPEEYLRYFEQHYRKIVILFDNDGKHNGHLYPYSKVFVPVSSGAKDISDYRKLHGEEKTRELLRELLDDTRRGEEESV